MVDQTLGTLLTCNDEATQQFVQFLNSQSPTKFILRKFDSTHLFVTSESLEWIVQEMDKFSDSNAYTHTDVIDEEKRTKGKQKR
jgi:hypothetical protein